MNRDQLRRAFLDESGLQNYRSQIPASPTTSDQWDEFLLTVLSVQSQYEKNGGFYHVKVPDLRSLDPTESDAKQLIKRNRAMTDNLTFLSPPVQRCSHWRRSRSVRIDPDCHP